MIFVLSYFVFRKLGWDARKGESHLDVMLRGELLVALAQFGHKKTINEATRRFHIFLNDRITSVLPPDTRKVDKFMTNYYLSLHFAPSEIDIEIIL